MERYEKGNMTAGNPMKIILVFSIPIFIGCIFQQLYNAVDTAVVGHVLGDDSLAAVGATSEIYNFIIGFASGLTNGFAIIIGQFFGTGEQRSIKKAVTMTYILTVVISLALTILSLVFLHPLLKLLQTPAEIFEEAARYIFIILLFSAVTIFYNMLAAMLRAVGNSKIPLLALICSSIINIFLDILFVKVLALGIAGAAYATVIAQAVSALICLSYISRHYQILQFRKQDFTFDLNLLKNLISTGLSMGFMIGFVTLSSLALQSSINALGPKTIAAHTAARRIRHIFVQPLDSLGIATATFVSQNYGAQKHTRVLTGIRKSLLLSFMWSGISCLIIWTSSRFMVTALSGTTDAFIIKTAVQYLKINISCFFVLSVLLVLRNGLQGMGHKAVPVAASIMELLIKLATVFFIAPRLGYLGISLAEPVIWLVGAVMVFADLFFTKQNLIKEESI